MIKITGKFWLLALCLSLIVNVAFATESNTVSSKITGFYATPKTTESGGNVNNGGTAEGGGSEGQGGTPEGGGSEGQGGTPEGGGSEGQGGTGGTVNPDVKDKIDKTDENELAKDSTDVPRADVKKEDGIFSTVLSILPGLIVVVCLILIWKNIDGLKKRLLAAEDRLEKIVPPESEGSSELNNNLNDLSEVVATLRRLEKRISALETDVLIIQGDFEKILKSIKKPAGTHMETQPPKIPQYSSYREEIPPSDNYSKTTTATTPRPLPPLNKASSSEISKITEAFNKMMLDSTRQEGIDLWELRNGFIMAYDVVAFKCVNYQERVNKSEVKPQFKKCQPSESTLWGIQLSDGTFAVLPGLREYEMTAHSYGGLKELFQSNYRGGTYRKIEVMRPAIMKSDFSLVTQGELRLSQY